MTTESEDRTEEEDSDDERETPGKKPNKVPKKKPDPNPHCTINFVKNTYYKLLAGDTNNNRIIKIH